MKKIAIILLIGVFLAFLAYELPQNTYFQVLNVNSPTQIVIDTNKNGVEDDDEIITLKNVQSFSIKPNEAQSKLIKKLKITPKDAIGLGYLAQNFAKETLADKKVKLNNEKTQILVDNKNYETSLLNSGFAVKDKRLNPQVQKNLIKVRKLNLKILNNKNHKYHKLTCKYGLIAHNAQIIPTAQLPKDAKPCKFCLVKHEKHQTHKKYNPKYKCYEDEIPNIKSPPTIFQKNLAIGSIKMFLTDLTKVLKPTNSCDTPVCKALVNEINSAQNSIDFAIYGYTKVPAIQKALENAQTRGVKVRFVYDLDDKNNNIYPDTTYLAKILTNNMADNSPQLMHDKFFIFDHKIVFTGSANISNTDMSGFNSNVVILINSPKIADIYSQEFEQMYSGKFHKLKSKFETQDTDNDFQVYFSPQDRGITKQIIPLINSAQKYIYMPVFLITHKDLTDSLINASKREVAVKVILDATNSHGTVSKIKILRQNGIQVKTENYAGKLHSKSIIIDDLYTVIGSMNFSRSGESVNDENLVIIKDKDIAIFYKTFFQYLWKRIPDKWLKLSARAESPDSIGSCNDGIDNDFDGKIDKLDNTCTPTFRPVYKKVQ